MTFSPFFSICIETKNRFSTIERTLMSVLNQDTRDFELILVDNNSSDRTLDIVNKFFNSEKFKKRPFNFLIKSSNVNNLENWNKPIELASGKFIAYLEGDDSFLENHLSYAKNILIKNPNVGLYFAQTYGKERKKFNGIFNLNKCDFLTELLEDTPAPSTMIFKRIVSDKVMLFNLKDYKYAPEIDLYLKIRSFDCEIFFSDNPSVKRDVERIPKSPKSDLKFHDRNIVINKWGKYFKCEKINYLREKNYKMFFNILINHYSNNEKNGKKLWRRISVNLKEFNYLTYLKFFIAKCILQYSIYIGLFKYIKWIRSNLKSK